MDSKVALTLILIGTLVGAGMIVYNADNLYLSNRENVVACMPARMVGGYETSLIATATDSNGDPASDMDVTVSLETENETYELFTGKTDSSGTVQPSFTVPHYQGEAELVVTVGDERLSQKVKVEDSESGDFTTKILITTDKPIYQPDQTVHIRTLTYEGFELSASQNPAEFEITDANGNKIFRKSFQPNEFGIASLDYELSDQLPLGTYKIKVTVGNASAEKSVRVEKYVLPKFKIDLLDAKTWYTVDEIIEGKVSAKYFFGQEVEGTVVVDSNVYWGVWEEIGTRIGNLENGEFSFSFPAVEYVVGLDINEGNGLLELNISVTDSGGHNEYETHIFSIATEPIQITTLGDTNLAGTESTYYIIARYPNGQSVDNAQVTVEVGDETFQKTTDSRGIAQVTFSYSGQDDMAIDVVKGSESAHKDIIIAESYGIKVITDKSLYEIGETAQFSVYYTGSAATENVYYDAISEGFVVTTGRVKLDSGEADFEIPITPDMSPAASIRVYKIEKDMDVVRDSVLLLVSSPEELVVNITTDKDIYKPNEDVRLTFHIANSQGSVLSAIGISAVDMSVFEISERFSGFDDVFWGLEEEFLTPQYQIISYVFDPTPVPLPVEAQDEIPKSGDQDEIGILSTWPAAQDDAKEVKNDWVNNYWGAIALLAILGYFGLFALAMKYKASSVVALFLVITLLFAAAAVFVLTEDMSTSETKSPELFDADGGDADAFEGGGLERDMDGDGIDDALDAPPGEPEFWGGPFALAMNKIQATGNGTGYAPTHVRTYFPETWYWNPALITDENGEAFVTLTTPDSITSWGIEAIASTKDAQIGTGNTEVTVFQEFFVEPDIPVSVIRNDEFPLRVLVYNYESTTSTITVELAQDSWFELLSDSVANVDVEASSVSSVDFVIKALVVGEHNITINASSATLEDKIVKEMRVDPDGKREDVVENGQLDNNQTVSIAVELDPLRVEGSENAYVKLQGGMEAVTLDGAETFIRFVSGCGEQSMSTLSINILAYDTVQQMDGTNEKLFEYETIVNQGIQHELTFLMSAKNGVGRGIVWFPSDQDVHPWLTSWGLITFQDARNAGFILDDDIFTDMQDWLVSQQNTDGSYKFPDWGIYETNNPILKAKKVATTAYITRALLYSGFDPTDSAITKSLTYIETNINEHWDDAYTLALCLIALEDAGGSATQRTNIASRLDGLKQVENQTVYWTSDNNMISDGDDSWRYRYSSPRIIEATGYAIMALSKHGGYSTTVNKAVNYLLAHRNGLGGFFSTQDTVVAFQALSSIGEIDIEEMSITVSANSYDIDTIVFTEENKDITYLIDLRPYLAETTTVTLTSSGEGSVLYQVYSSQYIPWDIADPNEPPEMSLEITYSTTNITVNDQISATLRLEYLGNAAKLKMVLVDLRAPVGFSFVSEDFEELVEDGTFSNFEINDREAMVYIQDVYPDTPLVFTYHLLANKPVKGMVQGIHAFDMYNPDLDVEVDPVEMVALL